MTQPKVENSTRITFTFFSRRSSDPRKETAFVVFFFLLSTSLSLSLSLSLSHWLHIFQSTAFYATELDKTKKENISKIEKSVELKKVSSAVPTVSYQTKVSAVPVTLQVSDHNTSASIGID
jgi:hypothetical protein